MVKWILTAFLAVMNVAAFVVYGLDKKIAQHGGAEGGRVRRISERALFLWALLGGGIGAFFGMYFWHHKNNHWYFALGIPVIAVLEAALAGYLYARI